MLLGEEWRDNAWGSSRECLLFYEPFILKDYQFITSTYFKEYLGGLQCCLYLIGFKPSYTSYATV